MDSFGFKSIEDEKVIIAFNAIVDRLSDLEEKSNKDTETIRQLERELKETKKGLDFLNKKLICDRCENKRISFRDSPPIKNKCDYCLAEASMCKKCGISGYRLEDFPENCPECEEYCHECCRDVCNTTRECDTCGATLENKDQCQCFFLTDQCRKCDNSVYTNYVNGYCRDCQHSTYCYNCEDHA